MMIQRRLLPQLPLLSLLQLLQLLLQLLLLVLPFVWLALAVPPQPPPQQSAWKRLWAKSPVASLLDPVPPLRPPIQPPPNRQVRIVWRDGCVVRSRTHALARGHRRRPGDPCAHIVVDTTSSSEEEGVEGDDNNDHHHHHHHRGDFLFAMAEADPRSVAGHAQARRFVDAAVHLFRFQAAADPSQSSLDPSFQSSLHHSQSSLDFLRPTPLSLPSSAPSPVDLAGNNAGAGAAGSSAAAAAAAADDADLALERPQLSGSLVEQEEWTGDFDKIEPSPPSPSPSPSPSSCPSLSSSVSSPRISPRVSPRFTTRKEGDDAATTASFACSRPISVPQAKPSNRRARFKQDDWELVAANDNDNHNLRDNDNHNDNEEEQGDNGWERVPEEISPFALEPERYLRSRAYQLLNQAFAVTLENILGFYTKRYSPFHRFNYLTCHLDPRSGRLEVAQVGYMGVAVVSIDGGLRMSLHPDLPTTTTTATTRHFDFNQWEGSGGAVVNSPHSLFLYSDIPPTSRPESAQLGTVPRLEYGDVVVLANQGVWRWLGDVDIGRLVAQRFRAVATRTSVAAPNFPDQFLRDLELDIRMMVVERASRAMDLHTDFRLVLGFTEVIAAAVDDVDVYRPV